MNKRIEKIIELQNTPLPPEPPEPTKLKCNKCLKVFEQFANNVFLWITCRECRKGA